MQGSFDTVIVGAGTAGAALAWQLAHRGQRVVVVEKGSLEQAGATWCNAVSLAAFDSAGIARPQAPEDLGNHPTNLIAGWGPNRVRVMTDVHDVDMALLGLRLRSEAARAGAVFRERVSARGWSAESGLDTTDGPLRARVYVDASGLRGLGVAAGERATRENLCAAVQETRAVLDHGAARAFFERHEVPMGEVACFTSVAGGYSIVNVRMQGEHVAILTGSIPGRGKPSGRALLDDFVRNEPWIGPALRSGGRAIPLTGPPSRIDDGAWLRFGDAAGMVWVSHGSGIGPQLIASRVIAEVLARGGDTAAASAAWARECRPGLAEAAAFQQFSVSVTPELLGRWMRSGLLHPELVRAGIEQRTPRISARVVGALLRAIVVDPRGVPALLPGAASMIRARLAASRSVD